MSLRVRQANFLVEFLEGRVVTNRCPLEIKLKTSSNFYSENLFICIVLVSASSACL
jgi:hypothetical protein